MVNLAWLLEGVLPKLLTQQPELNNIKFNQLHLDSRKLNSGDLFIAVNGLTFDGRKFIEQAITNGALAVLSDCESRQQHGSIRYQNAIPVIDVYQLSEKTSLLARRFYQKNSAHSEMNIVGVTGTNGKSTVTHLMASWVALLGGKAAVMGTLGNGVVAGEQSQLTETANTTGDAISIARQLSEFRAQGVDFVAMEVSSHGLHQHRVAAVEFIQAIFTNLSRDHLDYHRDMQEYQEVKQILFKMPTIKSRIINSDDPIGMNWLDAHRDAIAFGLTPIAGHQQILGSNLKYSDSGIELTLHWAGKKHQLVAPLLGEFNGQNLLAALCGLLQLGYSLSKLIQVAPKLSAVPGRMECIRMPHKPLAVVDYAHTPDALEKALVAARAHCKGQLIAVLGCGGDRDKGKRPLMAAVAEKLADRLIFTDDNPRSESPEQIVNDMQAGLSSSKMVTVLHDRQAAITLAFKQAKPQDLILIAGKGHEDYQWVAGKKWAFSDQAVVRTLLGAVQ